MTSGEFLALMPGDVIEHTDGSTWMVGARLPSGQNPDGRITLVQVINVNNPQDWTQIGNVRDGSPRLGIAPPTVEIVPVTGGGQAVGSGMVSFPGVTLATGDTIVMFAQTGTLSNTQVTIAGTLGSMQTWEFLGMGNASPSQQPQCWIVRSTVGGTGGITVSSGGQCGAVWEAYSGVATVGSFQSPGDTSTANPAILNFQIATANSWGVGCLTFNTGTNVGGTTVPSARQSGAGGNHSIFLLDAVSRVIGSQQISAAWTAPAGAIHQRQSVVLVPRLAL